MAREQERAELHRTIWQIANDLRGSVDGWDFKNYVLGMLFYRFISENITAYINAEEHRAGNDYNISVSSYVEQPDTREKVDIEALNRRIAEIVARQNVLRTAIDAIITSL